MSKPKVTFIAEDGTPLKLWHLRAGMLIKATEYRHAPESVVLTVGYDRRKATAEHDSAANAV
jgi:hypothetical protein